MEVVCNLISYESTDWFCLPLSQEIGHIEYSARSQPSQRMRQKAWGKMLILKKKKKKKSADRVWVDRSLYLQEECWG